MVAPAPPLQRARTIVGWAAILAVALTLSWRLGGAPVVGAVGFVAAMFGLAAFLIYAGERSRDLDAGSMRWQRALRWFEASARGVRVAIALAIVAGLTSENGAGGLIAGLIVAVIFLAATE